MEILVDRPVPVVARARRLVCVFALFCAAAVASVPNVAAKDKDFDIGPPPAWVTPVSPRDGQVMPAHQLSDGVHYLLSDTQTRVEESDRVTYQHFALKAVNESGVEAVAHVEIGFDPAYQHLTLHEVNVHRGGRVIPKLDASAVRILQRERELEFRIYDGSKTANLLLDDVRVGDVVEYSFSVRGINPAFGGRQFGRVELQWAVPVRHAQTRLLVPTGRKIRIAARNTTLEPVIRTLGDYREYRWQGHDLGALAVEDETPAWFDPFPTVQWSEFGDWADVAKWAAPLYRVPQPLTPALQAVVERIAQSSADPGDRMLAVLRLVQREVRYLGIEIGPGSYAPTPPQVVLERRFGDCKDKSLLVVTLLTALGIEAQPALVSTRWQKSVQTLQPNPAAFNHVLVRARVHGRTFWIDPTRTHQEGDLESIYQPDYGAALLVDESSTGLVPMTGAAHLQQERSIHLLFDASDGVDNPVRFEVTTVASGASAESLRNTLATTSLTELQKQYLNFYARYYPGIAVAAPLNTADDGPANRVTVTERYVLSDFWKRNDAQRRREASIYAPDLDAYLRQPRTVIRSAPLGLIHPVDLTHTTEVRLPEAWSLDATRTSVDDPGFGFERRVTVGDKRLLLSDRFQSRADHVAAGDTARYAANIERARDALGYVLYKSDGSASPDDGVLRRFNWPVALAGALLLLIWMWLAVKLYRFDPPAVPAPANGARAGIGGWLILPAIGLVLTPVRIATDFVGTLPSYAIDNWAGLTTAGSSAFHPLWAPTLLFELGANLGSLVLTALLAILFFQKRRSVPILYIWIMGWTVLVLAVDLAFAVSIPAAAAELTPKEWGELVRSAVVVALWSTYFRMSKRVKATFVRGRSGTAPTSAPAAAGA